MSYTIKIELKIIKSFLSDTIYRIENIFDITDHKIENKTKCLIADHEYTVGQKIKEENLYRLKIPGVMISYK